MPFIIATVYTLVRKECTPLATSGKFRDIGDGNNYIMGAS